MLYSTGCRLVSYIFPHPSNLHVKYLCNNILLQEKDEEGLCHEALYISKSKKDESEILIMNT